MLNLIATKLKLRSFKPSTSVCTVIGITPEISAFWFDIDCFSPGNTDRQYIFSAAMKIHKET